MKTISAGFLAAAENAFPACRAQSAASGWQAALAAAWQSGGELETLERVLAAKAADGGLPAYLGELARLESVIRQVKESARKREPRTAAGPLNPTLRLVTSSWRGLVPLLRQPDAPPPVPGEELVLAWHDFHAGMVRVRPASARDLLALKLAAEEISAREAAAAGGVPEAAVRTLLAQARQQGLLLTPSSRLRRDPAWFEIPEAFPERFLAASVFTIQWHITQACDLHCRHCYDRSSRRAVSLGQGLELLDQLVSFCAEREVQGQVSFSGGNPFLHPHFCELYQAAVERGLIVAILGNPVSRQALQEVVAIQKPAFYQVSLEGLASHNDDIRGQGHFERVMAFLELLAECGVYSMVMLTLTRANQDQVLPLAEILRERVDLFTFNRLAMVGEGAHLESAPVDTYADFLAAYLAQARENPVLSLKENLFNLLRQKQGESLFGGCAGYGCGAAFNFVSVLPDGEVHACRKFPSPIGNLATQSLGEVYGSPSAARYRAGCVACRDCPVRPVCGGCLAVSHGFGLDPLTQRDPYCFAPGR